jgi:sarcosine oxidase subunit delta
MKPRRPRSRIEAGAQDTTDMLLIPCPYCGPRAEVEFTYGGEAHIARPRAGVALSLDEWAAYQYQRSNTRGPHAERWRHARGCGRFFNVLRDTTDDAILATYRVGEPRPAPPGGAAR